MQSSFFCADGKINQTRLHVISPAAAVAKSPKLFLRVSDFFNNEMIIFGNVSDV